MNAQEALPIRQCLINLGHPQPPTPIKTDNSTANGYVNGTIKQKMSKAFDMRFHWLKDRERQQQFKIRCEPGANNLADYVTKHHTASHHQLVRPIYLYDKETSPKTVQGCIEILNKGLSKKPKTQSHKATPHAGLKLTPITKLFRPDSSRQNVLFPQGILAKCAIT